jgi:hypothetical protein
MTAHLGLFVTKTMISEITFTLRLLELRLEWQGKELTTQRRKMGTGYNFEFREFLFFFFPEKEEGFVKCPNQTT